jgi:hypothetical protein
MCPCRLSPGLSARIAALLHFGRDSSRLRQTGDKRGSGRCVRVPPRFEEWPQATSPRMSHESRLYVPAAQSRPSLAGALPLVGKRAQGKPGAGCTRSLACEMRKHTSKSTTGSTGATRPSLRDGVNRLLRTLPGDQALLSPSPAEPGASGPIRPTSPIRKLDANPGASGPYDSAVRTSRARRTRCLRPSHPAPNTRDDREAPLLRARDGAR